MLRKLLLLIWKNMLLRRRHWIVTTLEVLLPTICAAILAYSSSVITELKSDNAGGIKQIKERVYDIISEDTMIYQLTKPSDRSFQKMHYCSSGCPYSPTTVQTVLIMSTMQQYLKNHGVKCSFYPMKSEKDIEEVILKDGVKSSKKEVFDAAFVFQSGFPVSNNKHDKSVSYKIRMKYEFSSYVTAALGKPIRPVDDTEKLFPAEVLDPHTDEGERQKYSYVESGFIGFQTALDQALIKVWTGKSIPGKISLQPFPSPSYKKRDEKVTLSSLFHSVFLPTLLVLGFIFIVPSTMLGVVSEKESGIRELLKMNGVAGWLQWIGWLINSVLIQTLSVTIVIGLLYIEILHYGDPGVWYFFLVLYMMSATSFCFFLSSFFVRPILATIVGIIIWLVSYFPIFAIFEFYPERVDLTQKLWACLSPNIAFYLAIKTMLIYERDGVGAQWSNIETPISPGDYFSLGYIIRMFFANIALYMLLTFYLENVLVTEFGVRRPLYYIFLPSTWNLRCNINLKFWKKATVAPLDSKSDHGNLTPSFETEPTDIPVGIRLINLRKVYDRNKVAVEKVNLKMFKGEIFVLLGHNGAGKTTTISMLTGMCSPSGGTVEINGINIKRNLEKVRSNLGLCPQFNMLFDKLTVDEHLMFFGRLKGVSRKNAKWQVPNLLRKLELWEKRNSLAKHLSGGQKRKLQLGIALIGEPAVVILDEPTSGMDPEARRVIWDVLLEVRGERTIIVVTHFMEEADVLGDRIAIMSSGKVQCCGTSSFLKQFYGTGYTLKLTLDVPVQNIDQDTSRVPSAVSLSTILPTPSSSRTGNLNNQNIQEILTFVQKHIPDAFLKKTQSANAAEVFITLPTETATTAALTTLFSDLPQEKENLKIKTIGMSHTTVDEVFLKVGELAVDGAQSEDEVKVPSCGHPRYNLKPMKLVLAQFMALLLKKILCTYRKRRLVLGQLIVPVILLIGAIHSCNEFFAPLGHPLPVRITLDSYRKPIVPVYTTNDQTFKDFQSIIGSATSKVFPDNSQQTFVDWLLKVGNRSTEHYHNNYIIAAAVHSDDFTAMYNTVPNHAAPLAINVASNAILKRLAPGADYRIQVTNHPFRQDLKLVVGSTKPELENIFHATVIFEVFMPIGLALLAATFIVLPMEEKICKVKQLQMMTIANNPLIYWGSAFVWDFFTVIVVISMMICCFPIFQSHEMYTSYEGTWVAFLILAVYGYCAIFFSYLMSHFAISVHGGFALVTIIHIITGLIFGVVVASLDILAVFTTNSNTRTILQSFGRLFPTYGAVISTTRYVEGAIDNGRCNVLTAWAKEKICENPLRLYNSPSEWEYLECCDACQSFLDILTKSARQLRSLYGGPLPECFAPKPYILWNNTRRTFDNDKAPIIVPGIAQELTWMLIMSLVYQILLFAMEYRRFILDWIEHILKPRGTSNQFVKDYDEDVVAESQRIAQIIATGQYHEDALIVHGLKKTFGKLRAVQQIGFGVHHGECFGLLGVNGAGKTTTFRILTGDERPTVGVVYALGKSLKQHWRKYLSNIGYCPQFDGIIGVLTGREMLQLFCRLRGISGKRCNLEADRWLKTMGLYKSGKELCNKYSGGMKRRLCAAIAMIGDPSIILLDEPTSGVDPVSRRQFWKVLQSVRDSGQAIILTSHSMDECETLCSRLAIMVNGQLQCIGGVQHLKNKFTQGYCLSMKIKSPLHVDSDEFRPLHEQIMEQFQPCVVKDKHNNFIQYEIQNVSLSWHIIFKTMEELKGIHEQVIENYSVEDTSLEDVFLSFAKKQQPGAHS